jgi:hypothetical protein
MYESLTFEPNQWPEKDNAEGSNCYSYSLDHMLLTGDVVVDSEVSFLHPEWPFGFDIDVPMGTKRRMAFLDRAAADKTLVGSYHLSFPGFGHVLREGSAYRWLPADWRWM